MVDRGSTYCRRYADIRQGLDHKYHGYYSEARQLLQDQLVRNVVRTAPLRICVRTYAC